MNTYSTEDKDNEKIIWEMTNIYTSEKLSNIAFIVLEQFVKNSNLPIKKCQYCDRFKFRFFAKIILKSKQNW